LIFPDKRIEKPRKKDFVLAFSEQGGFSINPGDKSLDIFPYIGYSSLRFIPVEARKYKHIL